MKNKEYRYTLTDCNWDDFAEKVLYFNFKNNYDGEKDFNLSFTFLDFVPEDFLNFITDYYSVFIRLNCTDLWQYEWKTELVSQIKQVLEELTTSYIDELEEVYSVNDETPAFIDLYKINCRNYIMEGNDLC